MKSLYILLLFLFFKPIYSQTSFIPPGTIRVNDTLFMDKAPVDNLMFLEFVDQVERIKRYNESAKLQTQELHVADLYLMRTLLDRSRNKEIYEQINLIKRKGSKRLSSEKYLEQPDFMHYPALYISKEMAEFYCNWRTKMVLLLWAKRTLNASNLNPPKIEYRLPTPAEFELAKETSAARSQLKILKKSSPLKIKMDRNEDVLLFFDLPEYTSIPGQYKVSGFEVSDDDPVLFRCVCRRTERNELLNPLK